MWALNNAHMVSLYVLWNWHGSWRFLHWWLADIGAGLKSLRQFKVVNGAHTHTCTHAHVSIYFWHIQQSKSKIIFFAWKSVSELGSCRTWKVRYLSITLAFVWKATPTMCVSLTAYSTLFMTGQLWLCIWFLNDILQYVSQSERQGFYQPPNFLVFLKLLQLPDITVRWVCQN